MMMTTQSCNYGGYCWMTMALYAVVWFGVASILVWLTWNQVIAVLFQMKKAKLLQALLFVGTLMVLLVPRWYMHKTMMMRCPYLKAHSGCCSHHQCHDEEFTEKDELKQEKKSH